MDLRRACDIAFVVFLVMWIVTRQVGLFLVIKSAYVEAPKFIPFKWAPEEGMYLTKPIYYGFVGLLTILLVLCTMWFYMAIMVAVRVVTGKGAEDVRSDSEEEDEISVAGDESDASSVAGFANGNGVASGRATPIANGHSNGHNGHAHTNGFGNGHSPASSLGSAAGLKHRK
jgi:acyl-CoA-dependent ceramide synthase